MPDDSSPDFRTAQSDRARNLRFERQLMRAGGISRSQARAALAGFAEERLTADRVAALASIPKQATVPAPVISSETQSFNPQPLTLGEIPGAGAGAGPSVPVAPQVLNKTGVFVIESGGTFSVETLDFYGE